MEESICVESYLRDTWRIHHRLNFSWHSWNSSLSMMIIKKRSEENDFIFRTVTLYKHIEEIEPDDKNKIKIMKKKTNSIIFLSVDLFKTNTWKQGKTNTWKQGLGKENWFSSFLYLFKWEFQSFTHWGNYMR